MHASSILRVRINARRKARVERILGQLGMTSGEAVNLLFTEIDRRKAIPFTVSLEDNSDIAPSVERVAEIWGQLDREDFSHRISSK
jgi:addiction module RelB/DinJ family antitoxin